MRIVSYGPRGEEKPGVVHGDRVIDLATADPAIPGTVRRILESAALDRVRRPARQEHAGFTPQGTATAREPAVQVEHYPRVRLAVVAQRDVHVHRHAGTDLAGRLDDVRQMDEAHRPQRKRLGGEYLQVQRHRENVRIGHRHARRLLESAHRGVVRHVVLLQRYALDARVKLGGILNLGDRLTARQHHPRVARQSRRYLREAQVDGSCHLRAEPWRSPRSGQPAPPSSGSRCRSGRHSRS